MPGGGQRNMAAAFRILQVTMEHPLTFVTAFYPLRMDEVTGGRNYTLSLLLPNIRNLLGLEVPMVIYTDPALTDEVHCTLAPFARAGLLVEGHDLHRYRYAGFIHEQRSRLYDGSTRLVDGELNDRPHLLYWQKPLWLALQAMKNPFQSDYFMWVDAGLFHHGIFPDSAGGAERAIEYPDTFFWPQNTASIFRPSLASGMLRQLEQHQWLMLVKNGNPYDHPDLLRCLTGQPEFEEIAQVVAGLFGGTEQRVLEFYSRYNEVLARAVTGGWLVLEEAVMTAIYLQRLMPGHYESFNTWHHSVEGDVCYVPPLEGQRAFWEIFRDWAG